MSVPNWWEVLLLALAAWRIWHLIAFDDIMDRPRRYVTRLSPGWRQEGDSTGEQYREKLANFITCPYCLGFWISGAVLGVYCVVTGWIGVFSFIVIWLTIDSWLIGAQRLLSSE